MNPSKCGFLLASLTNHMYDHYHSCTQLLIAQQKEADSEAKAAGLSLVCRHSKGEEFLSRMLTIVYLLCAGLYNYVLTGALV